MAIGDPISQPIPPVGTSGTTYASQIVAFLTEVKARLEAKVAMASLLVALLDMANNAIANVKYVGLYAQGSLSGFPVGSIAQFGGELYYVSAAGNVRITNAGHLDVVAALGITGDYAAPAELRYDLASLEYYAYSDQTAVPKKWARFAAQGYDIYGTLTSTTRVRLAWPGGSSYTLTIPTAVPATTQLVQMDNAGTLTATNTLANNENLTFQGTGHIKRGNETVIRPFLGTSCWQVVAGSPPSYPTPPSPYLQLAASGDLYYPIEVGSNKTRLQSVIVYGRAFVNPATISLYVTSGMGTATESLNVCTLVGSVTSISAGTGSYQAYTLTLNNPATADGVNHRNGEQHYIRIQTAAGSTFGCVAYGVVTDVDI